MFTFLIYACILTRTYAVIYDSYSGKPASCKMLKLYEERKTCGQCTVDVKKPCDPTEWRRVDGTCNNLKHPSRGSSPSYNYNFLPLHFSVDYEPRNAKSGEPLPLARYLRTELLQEGKASELDITKLVSDYIGFAIGDINSGQDIDNFINNVTTCCTPEGKNKYECTPVEIPVDDPVHRYSGVRCQNNTRPQTLQYFGCLKFGTKLAKLTYATATFDLSPIYRFTKTSIKHMRTFKNGLLKYDDKTKKETGKLFPIGNHTEEFNYIHCRENLYPEESLCFRYHPMISTGSMIVLVMVYRQHNYIANELHKLNPCWNDDMLFFTARDINIAIHSEIIFRELFPVICGKRNMIKDELISDSTGFRDLYDENIVPVMSTEFHYVSRWFHTTFDGTLGLYDKNGYFLNTVPLINSTGRAGFLALNNNIDKLTAGLYREPSAKYDHTVDYDLAERVTGKAHFTSDVFANDLFKGRFLGFAPYIKYREFCTNKKYKTFDDLKDVFSKERLHRLKQVYKNVENIDLMAGLWAENHIPGGKVPHTLYCIYAKQLKLSVAYDRHWYERPNRPHAFTYDQLQAVRKVTIAGVLCTNGDGVTKIQPKAFYAIHKKLNPLLDCASPQIGKLDLSPWKDATCK